MSAVIKIPKLVYFSTAVLIGLAAAAIVIQDKEEDNTLPVIDVGSESITVSASASEEDLLAGVTASDDVDGDLSQAVVVESISDFLTDGSRIVTYAVADNSDNVAKAEKTVFYSDYKPPEFQLKSDMTYYSSNTTLNLAEKITASDIFDGDLTPLIKLTDDNIVVGQGGTYYAEVSVYNSAGDCSKLKLPVFIESFTSNPSSPAIDLTDYLIYMDAGSSKPDWKQYISAVRPHSNAAETLSADSYESELIIDDSNVSLNEPGCYYVTFEYIGDNYLTAITRLVVVVR